MSVENRKLEYATVAIIFGIDKFESSRAECVCVLSSQNYFHFLSIGIMFVVAVEQKNKMVIAFKFRKIKKKAT